MLRRWTVHPSPELHILTLNSRTIDNPMTTMDTCTLQPAIHVLGRLLATVPDSALLVMVETTHPEYYIHGRRTLHMGSGCLHDNSCVGIEMLI